MAEETTHTFASAPWRARRIAPDEEIPQIGESAVWGADGDLVAAVSVGMTGQGLESAYERARLIAAAPDYHDTNTKARKTQHGTCEDLADLLRLAGGRVTGDLAEACYDAAREIEEAIDKATE